jgi:alpha-L-fucosidase 2
MHTPEPLVWTTPSQDSSGSMPLGNGDIGLNVWVEEGGDLLFYLSKTDAWDENARLLKLGRVRIALTPNPFAVSTNFRQELDLARGCIRIATGDATPASREAGSDEGTDSTSILIWVDANRPVIRLAIDSELPIEVCVTVEVWRTAERQRKGAEAHCYAGLRSPQDCETVYPDTIVPTSENAIIWCHRNRVSCWRDTLEHQDMSGWIGQGRDPLLHRTFGAMLRGDGMVQDGIDSIRTVAPRTRIDLAIHPLTAQTDTLEQWIAALRKQIAQTDAVALDNAFPAHSAWWQAFWQRSWIRAWGTPDAETVSRGYELQRFINACGGRGAFPIKFNGSIFTVEAREENEVFDPDYRRWGGGYWFQNTRLTYWPMIMSGDFDLMEPWFRMYLDALPFAMARTRACFGIDNAAMFPETMTFWGTFLNDNYGYNRGDLPPGLSENTYIRRYWQGMLELLAVLLDLYAVTEDETVLHDKLLVLAPPFLRFYRDYYADRDRNGKMRITPSQSLETWHEAVNPSPDIAGLQWVLDGLLALPKDKLPADLCAEWRDFREILPPLPTRHYVWEKRTEILPATEYDHCANSENPELYAVFPYRLFGIGKPNLDIGLTTWHARRVKDTGGWRQDAIQAACLGLTDEARAAVVKNFSTPHAGSRFPAFWGPNFDWIPDQDHGAAACIALQRMLMQWDDGKIRLLPAWPKEWNVDFRLHAPGRTVVEGRVEDGRMAELRVTPECRRTDVVIERNIPGVRYIPKDK